MLNNLGDLYYAQGNYLPGQTVLRTFTGNFIEYGMMQAYGEGFAILHHKKEFDLDLHQVAEIWRDGSVVQSWLLDLTAAALIGRKRSGPTIPTWP